MLKSRKLVVGVAFAAMTILFLSLEKTILNRYIFVASILLNFQQLK